MTDAASRPAPAPAPVRYSDDVEEARDGEAAVIHELETAFDAILTTTAEDYGHAVRSVHAKAHGVLEGTFAVEPGLPPELAQGLFARPGEHKALLRLSTNAGDLLPDAVGLPRGLALKVLDVEGERLPGAEGRSQDFIMVNGPVFQAKSTDEFAKNLKLLAATTDKAEGAKVALAKVLSGVGAALKTVGVVSPKINALGGAPNVDPLGETYYSVTPFRFGDHIAKFSIKPVAPALTALTGRRIDAHDDRDAIRTTVRSEMRGLDGEWEFRVQLCRDLDRQPVEDPTVEWREDEAPFVKVAVLRVTAQDSWDPERVKRIDEATRFSVWTGLAAHRPLGNINRARKATYLRSATFRAEFNRCPIHEPAG